jgi:hypothetical protein
MLSSEMSERAATAPEAKQPAQSVVRQTEAHKSLEWLGMQYAIEFT